MIVKSSIKKKYVCDILEYIFRNSCRWKQMHFNGTKGL